MNTYNRNTPCPKCGSVDASTEYVGHGMRVPLYYKGCARYFDCDVIEPHMHRKCGNCGYWWTEKPLDDIASDYSLG